MAIGPIRTDRNVRVVLDAHDELGEMPFWDELAGELLRVDTLRGRVHGWDPASGRAWTLQFDGEVATAVPRVEGGLLVAVDGDLVVCEPDGARHVIATVEEPPENRFNDCRCDPRGRLWAGTMSNEGTPGAAGLYRLEPGGLLERVLAGTTMSNGHGWSPAGERMYFIDTPTQRVDVFDFDAAAGALSDRRAFVAIDPADGKPDGMAVDAEGGIWVCLFGGGQIRRYDADGHLDALVRLPVSNPTSAAFGGRDLATLYVTSARHELSPERLEREPGAGAVLALDPGVRGLPGTRFGG